MKRFLVGLYCWYFNFLVLAVGPVMFTLLGFNIFFQMPVPLQLYAWSGFGALLASVLYQFFRSATTWQSPGERILGNVNKHSILDNRSNTRLRRWPLFIVVVITGGLLSDRFENLTEAVYPFFHSALFVALLYILYKKAMEFAQTFEWITALQIAVFIFVFGIFSARGATTGASLYVVYIPSTILWIAMGAYYGLGQSSSENASEE